MNTISQAIDQAIDQAINWFECRRTRQVSNTNSAKVLEDLQLAKQQLEKLQLENSLLKTDLANIRKQHTNTC